MKFLRLRGITDTCGVRGWGWFQLASGRYRGTRRWEEVGAAFDDLSFRVCRSVR
jgi:hypothetical protein